MSAIEFDQADKEALLKKLQEHMSEELEKDLSRFEAEFLLEFIMKDIGPFIYNQGLYDSKKLIEERFESIADSLYGLEKSCD